MTRLRRARGYDRVLAIERNWDAFLPLALQGCVQWRRNVNDAANVVLVEGSVATDLTTWFTPNCVVTAGQLDASGGNSAFELRDTVAVGPHGVQTSGTNTTAGPAVFEVSIKPGTSDQAWIAAALNLGVFVDAATGAIGASGAGITAVDLGPVGNGYRRFRVSYVGSAGAFAGVYLAPTGALSYAGTGNWTIYACDQVYTQKKLSQHLDQSGMGNHATQAALALRLFWFDDVDGAPAWGWPVDSPDHYDVSNGLIPSLTGGQPFSHVFVARQTSAVTGLGGTLLYVTGTGLFGENNAPGATSGALSVTRGDGVTTKSGAFASVVDARWRAFALVFDGANARLYVDGELDPVGDIDLSVGAIAATLVRQYARGLLYREMAIFNRALDAVECRMVSLGMQGRS